MVLVFQEAYVQGLSTRSVDDLVKTMGVPGAKSQASRPCAEIDGRMNAFLDRPLEGSIRMNLLHWNEFSTVRWPLGALTLTRRHLHQGAPRGPKFHSANPLERLNNEIKRCSNVVEFFPSEAVTTRLLGALMLEQNDAWAVARCDMTLEADAAICNDHLLDPAMIAAPYLKTGHSRRTELHHA